MSSALAIASVTYVMRDLLYNGLVTLNNNVGNILGDVDVKAQPLDRIEPSGSSSINQLNLFMYLATPNQGWRNQDLPSRNSDGDRISNPALALDLHYLLTAHGKDEWNDEILLGCGMQILHENPTLARNTIRSVLTPIGGPTQALLTALSNSGLAEQIELIKITPESMNTEEISRLWTAFGAKYRLNAAYKATVVLIQSQKTTKPALPVKQRNIYVLPFHQPVIESVSSIAKNETVAIENQKILLTSQLVIKGYQLKASNVEVMVGGKPSLIVANLLTDSQITVALPAGLQSGLQSIQIVHKLDIGSPMIPHQGVSSNIQAFVLCPKITIIALNLTNNSDGTRSGNINLTVEPIVGIKQKVVLFLNEFNVPIPNIYSFSVNDEPQNPLTIPITNVKAGTYLVRIQVDGAESPLEKNYDNPKIIIP